MLSNINELKNTETNESVEVPSKPLPSSIHVFSRKYDHKDCLFGIEEWKKRYLPLWAY